MPTSREQIVIILGTFLTAFIALLSAASTSNDMDLRKHGSLVEAQVVKIELKRGRYGDTQSVWYTYSSAGQVLTHEENVDLSVLRDNVGDKFNLYVDPRNPRRQIREKWTEGLTERKTIQFFLFFALAFTSLGMTAYSLNQYFAKK